MTGGKPLPKGRLQLCLLVYSQDPFSSADPFPNTHASLSLASFLRSVHLLLNFVCAAAGQICRSIGGHNKLPRRNLSVFFVVRVHSHRFLLLLCLPKELLLGLFFQ
jgi:hypothetical protein